MAAMRANVVALLEVERVDEFATGRTLRPEVVRETLVAFAASQWWFFEDTHVVLRGNDRDESGWGQSRIVAKS